MSQFHLHHQLLLNKRKSVPDFNLLRTPFFHSYNLAIELSNKKCKSNPSSFDSHRLHQLFFGNNNNENISIHSQKEQTNLKNLNINQEKNKKNYENQLNDSNYEKPLVHINNNNSSRTNKNPF